MRTIAIVALALAVLPAGTATADPRHESARFKVSLYGVQRYERVTVENAVRPDNCFDARGEVASRTVVRFHTRRPSVVRLTGDRSYLSAQWRSADIPLPVVAKWAHSGSHHREIKSCVDDPEWAIEPPPLAANCEATVDSQGYSLSFQNGRVEASESGTLVVPLGTPFEGCPWGDRSHSLYSAKRKVDLAGLLRSESTEIVLRARKHDHAESPDGSGSSDVRQRTTIYLTFKKVG